ncbi:hypothetical protein G6F61_007623 [Rhizopus arrhizus]|nr:hypothetical protein G6F61_007623 [Rhizopus arrhizus]
MNEPDLCDEYKETTSNVTIRMMSMMRDKWKHVITPSVVEIDEKIRAGLKEPGIEMSESSSEEEEEDVRDEEGKEKPYLKTFAATYVANPNRVLECEVSLFLYALQQLKLSFFPVDYIYQNTVRRFFIN